MFRPVDLISKDYVAEQRTLHARPKGYGGKGDKWAAAVAAVAKQYECFSILDYGCGQGRLIAALRQTLPHTIRLDEYDPAILGKDELPSFADLVVCTDVLEHIEPDRLDAVIRHLSMLARKAIYLVVATRPSNKTLTDGRNAHLTIQPWEWWDERVIRVTGMTTHTEFPNDHDWVAILTP